MNRQMFNSTKLAYQGFIVIVFLLLFGLPASAQGMLIEHNQSTTSISQEKGLSDPKELEAFLDPIFAEQMKELHIPGAVFVVVKDGEIFFAKGYGYADLEDQKPVIPNKTLFRVGSVSKLFAATAVMQLAEKRRLNLDDDVNKYLKTFQLKENYPEPVTFANLLTHTGGFDLLDIGIAARNESGMVPLGQYLEIRMPPRVLPPGKFFSYSNHGISLAGYLVEVTSGTPFPQYINENIFSPLDMRNSTFLQPIPPSIASDMAVGYEYKNNIYKPVPFDYSNTAPAGALTATATDMGNFMIAHLQDGRYKDKRILNNITAQDMHIQHFTYNPRLPGMAYGFRESFENNKRAISHIGILRGFSSLLFLLPEENLGFFVSYNTMESGLREELASKFLDHYYPIQSGPVIKPQANFQKGVERFTGSYRNIQYSRHTIEKLTALFGELRITDDGNGTLNLGSEQYVEVEPLVFQRSDGERYIAFREDNGSVTHMFMQTDTGPGAFEKLVWYETAWFHYSLLGICVVLFLSAVVWPIGFFISRRRGKSEGSSLLLPRLARWLSGSISALNLLFLIGFLIVLGNPYEIVYGIPPILTASLAIALLAAVLTIGLPIFTMLAWKNKYWGIPERLHYSMITLAALIFIWFLYYWNLLGFQF